MPIVAPFSSFQRGANVLDVCQDFGAAGDGVTDDWAAWNAALQLCSKYGQPAWAPSVNPNGSAAVFLLSRPLVASAVTIMGDGLKPILRAGGTMASLLSLSGRCYVAGLTFDGAFKTADVMLGMGMGRSRFDRCLFTGGTRSGCRLAVSAAPAVIGPITQVGSGPSIAISQPDPTLGQNQTNTQCIKIQTGGALDTATYLFAPSNGIAGPFFGPWPLHAQTRIPFLNGSAIYSDSGELATCNAGTYQSGTTYSWSYTSGGVNANDRVHWLDCEASNNGVVYASSGLIASYTAYASVTAPGTVSISSGSSRLTGSGTTFLSTGATDGAMMYVPGAKFPRPAGRPGTTDMTMVVCVLGDGEIELAGRASATVSGVAYSIGNGAGFWEDPGQAHANQSLYTHCEGHFNGGSAGRFAGLTGPLLLQFGYDNNSHAGRVHGTRSSD